jgi:hypothetical protein
MLSAKRLVKKKVTPGDDPFWGNTKSLLENGGVTPFISNFMSSYIFGGDPTMLAKSWAADKDEEDLRQNVPLAYPSPLDEDHNRQLHWVAQYYSVHGGARAAKTYYLDTLKGFLLGLLEAEQTDRDLLEEVTERAEGMTFSKMAHALELPRFARVEDNPLRLLAEFPLPIYITTSHHDFLELALSRANPPKEAVSEIFYWDDSLHHIPSIYDTEPNYRPSVERPLVYHLYGLDTYPESLVLAEEDYLDFLIKATSPDMRRLDQQTDKPRTIPANVIRALGGTALLLLGYEIYEWEFQALFRGIIRALNDSRGNNRNVAEGVAMQLRPGQDHNDPARVEAYLARYFELSRFKVYWGDLFACTRDLWRVWKG